MTVSATIHEHPDDPGKAYGSLIATELKAAHAAVPFTTADEVSSWVHRTYGNPRLRCVTNDGGTTIRLSYQEKKLLTISCQ